MNLLQRILIVFVVCLLSGCISMRVPETTNSYQVESAQSRQMKLQKMTHWHTSGAFSIQYQKKSDIANFGWLQSALNRYDIKISSALALYQLKIIGNKQSVALIKNGSQPIYAKTPEALLQKTVGWYLPITPLQYWYRGLPAPKSFGSYQTTFDRYGHLLTLQQAGWFVRYAAYQHVASVGTDLPQSIQLRHDDLIVKIVTKKWA